MPGFFDRESRILQVGLVNDFAQLDPRAQVPRPGQNNCENISRTTVLY